MSCRRYKLFNSSSSSSSNTKTILECKAIYENALGSFESRSEPNGCQLTGEAATWLLSPPVGCYRRNIHPLQFVFFLSHRLILNLPSYTEGGRQIFVIFPLAFLKRVNNVQNKLSAVTDLFPIKTIYFCRSCWYFSDLFRDSNLFVTSFTFGIRRSFQYFCVIFIGL